MLYYYNTCTTSNTDKRYQLYFHIYLFTQHNMHYSRAAPLSFAFTVCNYFWASKPECYFSTAHQILKQKKILSRKKKGMNMNKFVFTI